MLCLGTLLPVKDRDPGISYLKKCEAPASHGLVHDFHEARTWAKVRILEGFWAKSWKILSSWCLLHLNFHISFMTIYDIVFFLIWENHYELCHLFHHACWPSWTFVVQLGAMAWHQPQVKTTSTGRPAATEMIRSKVSGTDWQVAVLNAKVKLLDDRVDDRLNSRLASPNQKST